MMMLTALVAAALSVQAGEAIKVDLGRRQLVVRTVSPPREITFLVDPARTHIAAGGRAIALDAVRPGEWVLVAFQPGPPRLAVLVKAGAARPAAPRR